MSKKNYRDDITQEEIKERYIYSADTGLFTNKIRVSRRNKIGDVAGTLSKGGYVVITIRRSQYLAHRLAYLYVTGKFPQDEVDHVNGVATDNRWANLRDCNRFQNARNLPFYKNNKSGHKGIRQTGNKWYAYITFERKFIYLGVYQDMANAIEVRKNAEQKYFGAFTREENHAR